MTEGVLLEDNVSVLLLEDKVEVVVESDVGSDADSRSDTVGVSGHDDEALVVVGGVV